MNSGQANFPSIFHFPLSIFKVFPLLTQIWKIENRKWRFNFERTLGDGLPTFPIPSRRASALAQRALQRRGESACLPPPSPPPDSLPQREGEFQNLPPIAGRPIKGRKNSMVYLTVIQINQADNWRTRPGRQPRSRPGQRPGQQPRGGPAATEERAPFGVEQSRHIGRIRPTYFEFRAAYFDLAQSYESGILTARSDVPFSLGKGWKCSARIDVPFGWSNLVRDTNSHR